MNLAERLSRLTIYKGLRRAPVAGELIRAVISGIPEDACGAFSAAAEAGLAHNIARAVSRAVIFDDNPFTRGLGGGDLPDCVREAAEFDLETLYILSNTSPSDIIPEDKNYLPKWEAGEAEFPLNKGPWQSCTGLLRDFYKKNGVGMFARYGAFLWQGTLIPAENPDTIRLADLYGYEREREQIVRNTERHLQGRAANNILLYGDKGTGKSATVHALLNEYREQGLRIIEIPREHYGSLPALTSQLKEHRLRFILFLDDLSFSESDDGFAALKAVLEGSLETTPPNCLIYATSNRRHLIRERCSDREGEELHAADSLEETLALSDRFGMTVTFIKPPRDVYFNIIKQLAREQKITTPEEELLAGAERWALLKGGRSPRAAVQYLRSITDVKGDL